MPSSLHVPIALLRRTHKTRLSWLRALCEFTRAANEWRFKLIPPTRTSDCSSRVLRIDLRDVSRSLVDLVIKLVASKSNTIDP